MTIQCYSNQQKAADEIFNEFKSVTGNNYPPVLLIAQPQSGKTLTVIRSLEQIIDHNLARNLETKIFWIQPSDSELIEQTNIEIGKSPNVRKCLLGDQIYHAPHVKHNSALASKIKKDYEEAKLNGHYIVVVIDEAHIGIGDKQTMPSFFVNTFGFFPGYHDSTSNVFTIAVTATPTTYLYWGGVQQNVGVEAFRYVYLHPGTDYNSFKHMRDVANRLAEAKTIKVNDNSFDYFHDHVLANWVNDPSADGYFIVRTSKMKDHLHDSLEKIVKDPSHPLYGKFSIKVFSSDGTDKKISELNIILNQQPYENEKIICIIIGSYLQGKNFKNMQYVRGWWDRVAASGSHHTFSIQSTGRNCGYGKKSLGYKIYMDIDKLDDIIRFYDLAEQASFDKANGVVGAWHHLQRELIIWDAKTKIASGKNGLRANTVTTKLLGIEDTEIDVQTKYSLNPVAKTPNSKRKQKPYRLKLVSDQKRDLAGDIVAGTVAQQTDTGYIVIHADDYSKKNPKNSWPSLIALYPNAKGKYFVYQITKTPVAARTKSTYARNNFPQLQQVNLPKPVVTGQQAV